MSRRKKKKLTSAELIAKQDAALTRYCIQKYGERKRGAFSSLSIKHELKLRVDREKRELLKPRMLHIVRMKHSMSEGQLLVEVEDYLTLSHTISCKMKPSFTMEEAGVSQQIGLEELTPYICRSCGFVHFGHDPLVLTIQKEKPAAQVLQTQEVAA